MMTPKQSVALCAALVALSHGEPTCNHQECAQDGTTLLQMQTVRARSNSAAASLLQTAHEIMQKVKDGQDPTECAQASDNARTTVEAALNAIPEQHTHQVNQITIATNNVNACANRESDGLAMVTQQGTNLDTARTDHASCRQDEEDLQAALSSCTQFDSLRNTIGTQQCFTYPGGDGTGYVEAMETARDTLNAQLTQLSPLEDACNTARTNIANKEAQCATDQSEFEEQYCTHRASCASLQICRATAEENYELVEAEVQAAIASLKDEYQVMTHVECLLGHADDALASSSILNDDVISSCSTPASTDHLDIDYPVFEPLTTCDSTILTVPPCESDFLATEYGSFTYAQETIVAACSACQPIAGLASAPQSWLAETGIVDWDNLSPAEGSPAGCTCTAVDMVGEYSAGRLVRCDNCLDTFRATDPNSCPTGFKLYSPRSPEDWITVRNSVDFISLRSPHNIVDVTRPANGCGGCTSNAMNSNTAAQSSWVTSDGTPWHIRSTAYGEPNGDYTANCYLYVHALDANGEATINDGSCSYHANKYLCQMIGA